MVGRRCSHLHRQKKGAAFALLFLLSLGCSTDFDKSEPLGHWTYVEWPSLEDEGEYPGFVWSASAWTGSDFLIWGGMGDCSEPPASCRGGLAFTPETSSWRLLSSEGAPSGRVLPAGVWSGEELIVWGGQEAGSTNRVSVTLADGGAYRPDSDTWRPLSTDGAPTARSMHGAVWTGKEMLVWGGSPDGSNGRSYSNTGGIYDPLTDSWRPMNSEGAPSPRTDFGSCWTGKEWAVWGGRMEDSELANTGGLYNPETDSWRATSLFGAPSGRVWSEVLCIGEEIVVGGGAGCGTCGAAAYDLESETWRLLPKGPNWEEGSGPAVFTGSQILVYGALNPDADAAYDPSTNKWTKLSAEGAPARRASAYGAWTGEAFLVLWGGDGHNSWYADGGLFYP